MSANSRGRIYDYRIREQIVRTGNPDLVPELGILCGTALTWIRRGTPDVVLLDQPDDDKARLRERIARLERRVAAPRAPRWQLRHRRQWRVATACTRIRPPPRAGEILSALLTLSSRSRLAAHSPFLPWWARKNSKGVPKRRPAHAADRAVRKRPARCWRPSSRWRCFCCMSENDAARAACTRSSSCLSRVSLDAGASGTRATSTETAQHSTCAIGRRAT